MNKIFQQQKIFLDNINLFSRRLSNNRNFKKAWLLQKNKLQHSWNFGLQNTFQAQETASLQQSKHLSFKKISSQDNLDKCWSVIYVQIYSLLFNDVINGRMFDQLLLLLYRTPSPKKYS